MNVKRIVVDELPNMCIDCKLSFYSRDNGVYICFATKNKIANSQVIPEWCPLELEEVCEWKFWWTEEYSGDPEDTPDSILNLITVCEWDYPELTGVALDESGDVAEFMMRVGYDYCPNCGKRIVYKESDE